MARIGGLAVTSIPEMKGHWPQEAARYKYLGALLDLARESSNPTVEKQMIEGIRCLPFTERKSPCSEDMARLFQLAQSIREAGFHEAAWAMFTLMARQIYVGLAPCMLNNNASRRNTDGAWRWLNDIACEIRQNPPETAGEFQHLFSVLCLAYERTLPVSEQYSKKAFREMCTTVLKRGLIKTVPGSLEGWMKSDTLMGFPNGSFIPAELGDNTQPGLVGSTNPPVINITKSGSKPAEDRSLLQQKMYRGTEHDSNTRERLLGSIQTSEPPITKDGPTPATGESLLTQTNPPPKLSIQELLGALSAIYNKLDTSVEAALRLVEGSQKRLSQMRNNTGNTSS